MKLLQPVTPYKAPLPRQHGNRFEGPQIIKAAPQKQALMPKLSQNLQRNVSTRAISEAVVEPAPNAMHLKAKRQVEEDLFGVADFMQRAKGNTIRGHGEGSSQSARKASKAPVQVKPASSSPEELEGNSSQSASKSPAKSKLASSSDVKGGGENQSARDASKAPVQIGGSNQAAATREGGISGRPHDAVIKRDCVPLKVTYYSSLRHELFTIVFFFFFWQMLRRAA